jgi:enoyl-CoA hydratase/carnithine racemase
VGTVVITGEGRGFCSGGDVNSIIGELFSRDAAGLLEFTRLTCDLIRNMRSLKKPIIAALNGTAAGAGAVIALASDLRIAADNAKIAFLFVKVGLAGADMGAAYLLPRVVGLSRATELLYFGDAIDAATAERYGLFNKVVPKDSLRTEAMSWAKRLCAGPTFALGVTKELLNEELDGSLPAALDNEARAQALCMHTHDFKEAYEAFTQKRPTRFTGH